MSSLEISKTASGGQSKEQLILEAYNWSAGCGGNFIGVFRNVGPANLNFGGADMFINGVEVITGGASASLAPGSATTATLPTGNVSPCINGAAYPLKIVTPSGGVFSYSVIAGSAT
jgi:hypothetical protein